MTAADILAEIEPLGLESYRKVIRNHGVQDPMYGVKIEELKKIQKRIKKDYQLALDLWETGVYDARYLAGLIADDARMTKADLNHWVDEANCSTLFENAVPWVAAEGALGHELAIEWIESDRETVAAAGWATLSCLVALREDTDLDLAELTDLLHRVRNSIHQRPNRVRLTMNGFMISVGSYVTPLTNLTIETAEAIGRVFVDVGATACKVAYAPEYIEKVRSRGALGRKRKTVKC